MVIAVTNQNVARDPPRPDDSDKPEISVETVRSDCDLGFRQFRLEFASVVNMCWWCVLGLGLVLGLELKIRLLPDWSGTGAFAIGL